MTECTTPRLWDQDDKRQHCSPEEVATSIGEALRSPRYILDTPVDEEFFRQFRALKRTLENYRDSEGQVMGVDEGSAGARAMIEAKVQRERQQKIHEHPLSLHAETHRQLLAKSLEGVSSTHASQMLAEGSLDSRFPESLAVSPLEILVMSNPAEVTKEAQHANPPASEAALKEQRVLPTTSCEHPAAPSPNDEPQSVEKVGDRQAPTPEARLAAPPLPGAMAPEIAAPPRSVGESASIDAPAPLWHFWIRRDLPLFRLRLHYPCPHCGVGLTSPLKHAGDIDFCPDCKGDFVLPSRLHHTCPHCNTKLG